MLPEDDLISIQTHKEITNLYKSFLILLEDLKIQHSSMLEKISKETSPEFADKINFFTASYYEQLRKRILDNGNDCERQLLSFLDFFNFNINQEKVHNVAQHQKVVKKFMSFPISELK